MLGRSRKKLKEKLNFCDEVGEEPIIELCISTIGQIWKNLFAFQYLRVWCACSCVWFSNSKEENKKKNRKHFSAFWSLFSFASSADDEDDFQSMQMEVDALAHLTIET